MQNLLTCLLLITLAITGNNINCQPPVLSVQSFEYIWQKASTAINEKAPLILAAEDSIKHSIEKSFATAIQQRWNIETPQLALTIKPWSLFSLSDAPRFNTKVKEKRENTWYLFLQIFANSNTTNYYNVNGSRSGTLDVKCKVVRFDDSVILDKKLLVKLNTDNQPSDQVSLKGLPAYPSTYAKAFDTIAAAIFLQDDVTERNISLKPACIFSDTKFDQPPLTQLEFKNDNLYIENATEPQFSFHVPDPTYVKTKTKDNTGGNIANGTIALFTGLSVNKKKTFDYLADFPFETHDSSVYHCFIHFSEVMIAEIDRDKEKDAGGNVSYSLHSSEFSNGWRKTDPGIENFVTLKGDTLITFKMKFAPGNEYKTYTRFWDGSDSSTISDLPEKWRIKRNKDNVTLEGTMEGVAFHMQSSKEFTEKRFYFNDKPAMITYGSDAPIRAILFQPLSEQQIKLFTILSSIPYSYFNTLQDDEY